MPLIYEKVTNPNDVAIMKNAFGLSEDTTPSFKRSQNSFGTVVATEKPVETRVGMLSVWGLQNGKDTFQFTAIENNKLAKDVVCLAFHANGAYLGSVSLKVLENDRNETLKEGMKVMTQAVMREVKKNKVSLGGYIALVSFAHQLFPKSVNFQNLVQTRCYTQGREN